MNSQDPIGISVVIPLYNKAETVVRAIDSVLAQRQVAAELIVVDDGSSDGSLAISQGYGDRIRLIRQANRGPSAARNRGVKEARFPWVSFLDADDEYLPGCLAHHAACLSARPDVRATMVSFCFIDRCGNTKNEVLTARIGQSSADAEILFVEDFRSALVINVHIGAVCVSRDLFLAIGGFDEQLVSWEITDFLVRLVRHTGTIAVSSHIRLLSYDTPDSQSTKTHRKIPYVTRVTSRLLDEMESIPENEQKPLLAQMKSFLYTLWELGALGEFHRLVGRAHGYFRLHELDDRFTRLGLLPLPALRALHGLRGIKQRLLS